MKGYIKLRNKALKILQTELSNKLYYHGLGHTLDVLHVCNQYIKREKINPYDAKLLRLAALLHDIGFVTSNKNHEEHGVKIAGELMTEFGFSKKDFETIKGLIMATKIPQSPKNELEKIICDADLDYLGRSDFKKISDALLKELIEFSEIDSNQWNTIQIKFLEEHQYHTDFAKRNRQPQKEKRITYLKELVAST